MYWWKGEEVEEAHRERVGCTHWWQEGETHRVLTHRTARAWGREEHPCEEEAYPYEVACPYEMACPYEEAEFPCAGAGFPYAGAGALVVRQDKRDSQLGASHKGQVVLQRGVLQGMEVSSLDFQARDRGLRREGPQEMVREELAVFFGHVKIKIKKRNRKNKL